MQSRDTRRLVGRPVNRRRPLHQNTTDAQLVKSKENKQLQESEIMTTEEEMPLTLPDTQNADIMSQFTQSQEESSQEKENTAWGRLCPYKPLFKTLVMTKNEYTLGRSENCDICITEREFRAKWVTVISKIHFRIMKGYLSGSNMDEVVYLEDTSHNGTFVNKNLVGRGKRVILGNNDIISLAKAEHKVYIFMSTVAFDGSGLPSELKVKYAISRTLGTGACGEVKMVFSKAGCQKYAMKTIMKHGQRNSQNDPVKIMNEVRILKALKHPCIIRMEDIVDTPSAVYIVLELMEGGELYDRIRSKNGLSEKSTKLIFYQVVLAVHYLHQRGITHRDLKPENILLACDSDTTLAKVSDFGLSKFLDTESLMKTFCGTPMYVAPEVLLTHGRGSYTNQVDVWSLGVILYVCLSGLVPFIANDRNLSLHDQIVQGKYKFPRQRFHHVSQRAIDLIGKMLTVNPEKRITIKQVLLDPWLQDREMRSKVDVLIRRCEEEYDENTQPSELRACNDRRMEPPTAPMKRLRCE